MLDTEGRRKDILYMDLPLRRRCLAPVRDALPDMKYSLCGFRNNLDLNYLNCQRNNIVQ